MLAALGCSILEYPSRDEKAAHEYSCLAAAVFGWPHQLKSAAKRRKDDGEPMAKLRKPDVSPLQADIDDFIDQAPDGRKSPQAGRKGNWLHYRVDCDPAVLERLDDWAQRQGDQPGSGDCCGGGEVEIDRFGVKQAWLIRIDLICTANCRMIDSGGSCHVCKRCHSPSRSQNQYRPPRNAQACGGDTGTHHD
jgi:hypothetical protein